MIYVMSDATSDAVNEAPLAHYSSVVDRALQGYAPETAQQAGELVSGLLSVLPLDEPEWTGEVVDTAY